MDALSKFTWSAVTIGIAWLAYFYMRVLELGYPIYIPILDITINP